VTDERPVTLCGFMASGKSTVGRRIAHALARDFYDSDELVERALGKTIAELFAAGEEPRFRAEEAALIADLVAKRPPGVISLGGGALERSETRALVLTSTVAVYLDRPLAAITASLTELRRTRPLLDGLGEEEIAELYAHRRTAYLGCPIRVAVGTAGVDDVTNRVLAELGAHGIAP
jgi:shikimate kinase